MFSIHRPLSLVLLACFLSACAASPEDGPAGTDKAMPATETTPDASTQKSLSREERIELRRQHAAKDAAMLERFEKLRVDPTELTTGEAPDEVVQRVIDDLVKQTGAERADVEVMQSESLIYRDGSLGCAKPGQDYTHALVPGFRVVLEHSGQRYDYRIPERGNFILCDQPHLAMPGAGVVAPKE